MQTLFKELKVSISFQTTLTHTRLQGFIISFLSQNNQCVLQTLCWHLQQKNCLRNCDIRSLARYKNNLILILISDLNIDNIKIFYLPVSHIHITQKTNKKILLKEYQVKKIKYNWSTSALCLHLLLQVFIYIELLLLQRSPQIRTSFPDQKISL